VTSVASLLVALVASGQLASPYRTAFTLRGEFTRADTIVIGTVTTASEARPHVATVRVTQTLKGHPRDTLFVPNQWNLVVGEERLFFSDARICWPVVADGALLMTGPPDLALPKGLVRRDGTVALADLKKLFAAWRDKPATFRVMDVSCEPCSLSTKVATYSSAHDIDCGFGSWNEDGGITACIETALREGRAFHAARKLWPDHYHGGTEAIVGTADGGVVRVEEETNGGMFPCEWYVKAEHCGDASVAIEARWWQCSGSTFLSYCNGRDLIRGVKGPPMPISRLRCRRPAYAQECSIDGAGASPPATGADYVCVYDRDGSLQCVWDETMGDPDD
jgi:hypothetical protein